MAGKGGEFRFGDGWWRFVAALGFYAVAVVIRAAVTPLAAAYPYLAFYPATFAAFVFLGARPGWVVAVLSAATATLAFVPSPQVPSQALVEFVAAAAFLAAAAFMSWTVGRLVDRNARLEATQSRLAASEGRFAAVFHSSLTAILVSRVDDSRIVEVNDALLRMIGRERDQVVGRSAVDIGLLGSVAERDRMLFELRSGTRDLVVATRYRRPEGKIVDLIISACLVRIEEGEHVIAMIDDVSAENALHERDRLLVAALEAVDDGVAITDGTARIEWVNPAFERATGYSRQESIGRRMAELVRSGLQSPVVYEALWRTLLSGRTWRGELINRRKDGQLRTEEVHIAPLPGSGEGERRFIGVKRDLTTQKITEQAMRRLAQEQQAMLDNDLIAILKLHNRVIVWGNRATQSILGRPESSLVGRPARILFPSEDAYRVLEKQARAAMRSGHTFRAQIELAREDGERIWVDLYGAPLADSVFESMWMLADITAIKRTQERVEALALHDALTSLPNRRLLADRMEQARTASGRTRARFALCYLDLDDFKPVNDRYGHAVGDGVLLEFARRLQGCVRASDTVARVGGDEFVLLLAHLDEDEELRAVLQRAMAEISRPFVLAEGTQVRLSASIGLTVFPEDPAPAEDLLHHADLAMYEAKTLGRNRAVRWGAGEFLP